MLAKQEKIRAKLPLIPANIVSGVHSHTKQKARTFKIIDKTTEKTIVDCVLSMGTSKSSSTVYADLWVHGIKKSKIPKKGIYTETIDFCYDNVIKTRTYDVDYLSGKGSAGGHGYDKESQAVQEAIDECGIALYGTPYRGHDNVDFKKRCNIGGTGEHEKALLAIAYACGYNNVILVRS
jgi:hypothetical protein